jgi:hypothetical protein
MPLKKKKKVIKRKPAKKVIKKKVAPKRKLALKPKKKLAPKPKKKIIKKAAKAKIKKLPVIGIVTHYFPQVRAAVIKLKMPLATGDLIKIKGHTSEFTQTVTSMQMDRTPIAAAKKGQEIGLEVISRVREHDIVLKP